MGGKGEREMNVCHYNLTYTHTHRVDERGREICLKFVDRVLPSMRRCEGKLVGNRTTRTPMCSEILWNF